MLSDRAHVIFPWHIARTTALDKSCSSGETIGTTMRGIGPCYRRQGGPLVRHPAGRSVPRRISPSGSSYIAAAKNKALGHADGQAGTRSSTPQAIASEYAGYAERLQPYVADTTAYLLDAVEAGKRDAVRRAPRRSARRRPRHVSLRHQQQQLGRGRLERLGRAGTLDHEGHRRGQGHTTRVGGGPFPTEQDNDIGQHIRDRGNEYGTVTRRPRRCGWFDAVAVRYTARLSGVDALAVMLLDVLERAGRDQDLHGLRDRRPQRDQRFPATSTTCGAPSRLRDAARLASRTSRRAARWPTCRKRPAISGPAERVDRPAGGDRLGRSRPRTDDLCRAYQRPRCIRVEAVHHRLRLSGG